MLIERLKNVYEFDEPIFIDEIISMMKDYSRQRIYQMIAEAEQEGKLLRYDTGIYYMPVKTEIGLSVPSLNKVVAKKYIRRENEVFGIYGKYVMELNFALSTQVPNTIEIITNKESRDIRRVVIRGRNIILRKSRLPITNENASAYTLLEFFNGLDMKEYNEKVNKRVLQFINEEQIKKDEITQLAYAFPAKAMRNLAISGVIYEVM